MMRLLAMLLLMAVTACGQEYFRSVRQVDEVTRGLVGYWSMRTSGTNVFDEVGLRGDRLSTDGGAVGSPSFTSDGVVGNGVTFDGTARYIRVGHQSRYNMTTNFSVSAWCKFQFVSGGGGSILHKYNSSNDGEQTFSSTTSRGYIFHVVTNAVTVVISNTNAYTQASHVHGGTLASATWRHVAFAYGSGWCRMYIDGAFVEADALSAVPTANTEPLTLGSRRPDSAFDFTGAIDEIRLYNVTLTDAEMRRLYIMGKRILAAKGL